MTALFFKSYTCLMWNLYSLLICVLVSSTCSSDSDQACEFIDDNGTIILKKLNQVSHKFPNIKHYLADRFSEDSDFSFELYPDFIFIPEYFNSILSKQNLEIKVHFNNDLKRLVRRKESKVNEYVNKFLGHLLHMQNLEQLDLSSLNLTEVPKMVYKFKNLRALNLEYNDLDNLQFDWNDVTNLKSLKIGNSRKITKLGESIFSLPSLKTLRISKCSITEIPDSINKLVNLEILDISKTLIKSLPEKLTNLEELTCLTISDCLLEKIVISMNDHPKLAYVCLSFNLSLKYLKILIMKIPRKLSYFKIVECPLEEVEIWINLENTKFGTLSRKNQQLEDFDYVFKLNPRELFHFPKNHRILELKLYEFQISTGPGTTKTISIRKFNLEKMKMLNGNELINRWIEICKDVHLNSETSLSNEYNNSIEFLKSLCEIDISDYSDWTSYFPFEYKEKMVAILCDLLDKLEEKNKESRVEFILKMFKRPVSEQLIYYNYLLKYSELCSLDKKCFIDFIRESIGILKDFAFTTFLNSEKYERGAILRSFVGNRNGNQSIFSDTQKGEIYEELLMAIINAKKNFDSKFTIDYFSEIIGNVVALTDDPQFFFNNDKMLEFLLENCEIGPECFEYERKGDVDIIKKFSAQGMRVIISLIVDGQMPMPDCD